MSISLNVVNIAVSFFTATSRSAIFLRNIDIFSLLVPLAPPFKAPDEVLIPLSIASRTSCFVILPSFPLPIKCSFESDFSAIILAAAGEGSPLA